MNLIKHKLEGAITGELIVDPNSPTYPKLIEVLDNIGIQVFNYDRVQLPKVDAIEREPQAYT